MAGLLSLERREEVAIVTLQRPEKRNALSIDLRVELTDSFGALSDDPDVGAIVLTGAGPAFCSGMDTTQFGGDREHRQRLVETSISSFRAVGNCAKPVVAAVNGPALAGGFALALLCDLRLAAEEASFGFPELPRGIPPSYAAARWALEQAFGKPAGDAGSGGSIPLLRTLQQAAPNAEFILWGGEDMALARIHASDESVDPGEIERLVVAQALLLQRMSQGASASSPGAGRTT